MKTTCKRHTLWIILNREQNTKETKKLEWKRHTPEMAKDRKNRKKQLKATYAMKQLESDTCYENELENDTRHEIYSESDTCYKR